MALRIWIVDDHEVAREGLKELIGNHELTIAGSVSTAEEAVSALQTISVDLVLLDVLMDDRDCQGACTERTPQDQCQRSNRCGGPHGQTGHR